MIDRHYRDPAERAELAEQDLAAALATRRCEPAKASALTEQQPHDDQEVFHAPADQRAVGRLEGASMSASEGSPTVTAVRFEDLPLGSRGTRRAIARWSDGSESEARATRPCRNFVPCG
jgi:hypothetical protein